MMLYQLKFYNADIQMGAQKQHVSRYQNDLFGLRSYSVRSPDGKSSSTQIHRKIDINLNLNMIVDLISVKLITFR